MWERKVPFNFDQWDRYLVGLVELWPHSQGLGNGVRHWRSVSRVLTALFLRSWACGSRGR